MTKGSHPPLNKQFDRELIDSMNVPIVQWRTSKEHSSGGGEAPLTLVHPCVGGAVHLHADVSHLSRYEGIHNGTVCVTQVVTGAVS